MKKFLSEFKEFAMQGSVLDMAVGVIIGAAFKAIIDSVVNDILMPVVGILTGGHDFSSLSVKVGDAQIMYGSLIQNIINFLIVALFLFLFVKSVNKFKKKEKEEEEKEPEKPEDIKLLEEILSAIKEK